MASMKPRRFIFFPSFQPVFNSTSNLDTTRISSCYGCRYQAVNLVDLLIHSSNIIDSTHSCRNSSNHLDTTRISSWLRLPLLGGQPNRLTNSFVEYYRFDSLMSQLFKSLRYKTYLKLLRLPLSNNQPCRLTKSFVGYYRTNSSYDR